MKTPPPHRPSPLEGERGWVRGVCLLLTAYGLLLTDVSAEVRVGAAYEPFVLPRDVPLAGYSQRKGRPSQGVHDPVGVRALVIEDGTTLVALVSCELLIVDEALARAIRQRVRGLGLGEEAVLVIAGTHTHSGPGAYGRRFLEKLSMGHFDPAVFEAVVEAVAKAVMRAYEARAPALAVSRSGMTQGLVVNRVDAEGPADPELTVAGYYRDDSRIPVAVLVGFAAHPTTLGAWNRRLSGDYPGVLMREVERRFPGSVCLFFAGAVGDQAPVKAGIGFERAEWIGRSLADEVVRLLEPARPEPIQAVAALQEELPLPHARVRVSQGMSLPRWLSRQLAEEDATLSVVAIGPVVAFGVPCDLAVALGGHLKAAARQRGQEPIVIGFANDYIGYCLPPSLYDSGEYEALMAFNGPRAGELLVERLLQLLDQLHRSER